MVLKWQKWKVQEPGLNPGLGPQTDHVLDSGTSLQTLACVQDLQNFMTFGDIWGNAAWSGGWVLLSPRGAAVEEALGEGWSDLEGSFCTSIREVSPPPGRTSLLLVCWTWTIRPCPSSSRVGSELAKVSGGGGPCIFWFSLDSGRPLWEPSKSAGSDYIPFSWNNELPSSFLF